MGARMIAAPLIVGLHLATAHFGGPAADQMHNANPGAYLQMANGATAGAYLNSYGRPSVYAGWTWTTANGRWSLTAGGVTGYPATTVAPMLVPSMRIGLGSSGWAARLAYLHKPHSDGANGAHLSLERGW